MNQQLAANNACLDLNHYEMIAKILASELSGLSLGSEPLDVAETIETLTDEMGTMPEIINDCRLAVEAFEELDRVLDRMYSLADRAVEIGGREKSSLVGLDEEFSGYAHIIARLAGADGFDGPSLSLATVNDAVVARQILACLNAARHKFSLRLAEQRRRINTAMDEAVEMLNRILNEVEEISNDIRCNLSDLVSRLNVLGEEFNESPQEVPKPRWLN